MCTVQRMLLECVCITEAHSETKPSIKNETFSQKNKHAFTNFGKKLNLRHSTMYCEAPLYSPVCLPGIYIVL